ncbi:MAG: hypothetical protein IJW30_01235 [Clostridia bacterium]|nr:hypothetical protein [Clostridia bacterium]
MKKNRLSPLSRLSRAILHIEMPLILLQALVALLSYLEMRESDLGRALTLYPILLPYLLFPIPITIFTVLLIERLDKFE